MSPPGPVALFEWVCQWLILSLLITVPALLCLRSNRASARLRFTLGWVALASILGLPVLRSLPAASIGQDAAPQPTLPHPSSAAVWKWAPTLQMAETDAEGSATARRGGFSSSAPLPGDEGLVDRDRLEGEKTTASPADPFATSAALSSPPLLAWRMEPRLAAGLLLVVLLVGGWRSTSLVGSLRRISKLKRGSRRVAGERQWLERWRAVCPTRRAVRVAESGAIGSPVALGYLSPMILLPRDLAQRLSQRDLDQVGIHELAHLARRDDWSHLLQKLLEAWLWFHPGVLALGRRLSLDREAACDEVAVRLTGRPRAYARCLTRLLELQSGRTAAALGPGALGQSHQTERRIDMLLRTRPRPSFGHQARSLLAFSAAILLSAVLVFLTPPLLAVTGSPSRGGEHIRNRSDDRLTEVSWSKDGRTFELWIRGDVELNDELDGLTAISEGSSLKLRERRGLRVRSVTVRPGDAGLHYEYAVMGVRRDFDPEARAWFASALPAILQETGIYARERALEVLAEGGTDALLDFIESLEGELSRSAGYDVLLSKAELSPQQLQRVAGKSSERLETEHRLHEVLQRLAEKGWLPSLAGEEFFAAVAALPSEHRREELIERAIDLEGIEREQLASYYRALSLFPSEHRRDHLLERLINSGELDRQGLLMALAANEELPSEHRRHARLADLASSLGDETEVVVAYFLALDNLPSEHRREDVLRRLLARDDRWLLDHVDSVLEAVAKLPAEHRRAGLIRDLMPRLSADPEARMGLLESVRGLTTGHRVAELLDRLLDLRGPGELDATELRRMLEIAKSRVTVTRRGPLIERIIDRLLV